MDDIEVSLGVSALDYDGIEEGPSSDSGSFHYPKPTPSCISSTIPPSTVGGYSDCSDETQSIISEYSQASLVDVKFESILNNLEVTHNKSAEFCDSGVASFPKGSPLTEARTAETRSDIPEVIVHRQMLNVQPNSKDLSKIVDPSKNEVPEITLTVDSSAARSEEVLRDQQLTDLDSTANTNEFSFMTATEDGELDHHNASLDVSSISGRLQRENDAHSESSQ